MSTLSSPHLSLTGEKRQDIHMWPLAPSFRPFGEAACPVGTNCELPHCLFSHNASKDTNSKSIEAAAESVDGSRHAKRLKLGHDTKKPAIQSAGSPSSRTQPVFVGSIAHKEDSSPVNKSSKPGNGSSGTPSHPTPNGTTSFPRSATRPISPPKAGGVKQTTNLDPPVTLYPRKLAKEPATFTKRFAMLRALHQYISLLNDKVANSTSAEVKSLKLTENKVKRLAMDEEEKIGAQNRSVYDNVLKQRLVELKKMDLPTWVQKRKEAIAKENGEKPRPEPLKQVDTELTSKQEVIFLSRLLAPRDMLEANGYVTKKPTDQEILDTLDALFVADYWEICDRCNTRFQVFPDRREEDGALTTGGKCTHHWGKKLWPSKAPKNDASGQTRWTCCNEPLGSEGCTTYDTHVFKVTGVKRLSTILPFIETPLNDKVEPHMAICFDCEMGYTTKGLELLRLTAVSWPSHKPILDVLVRPLGQILDVNTRFSGVTPDQYFNAKPHDPENPIFDPKDLRIVDSPSVARALFLEHITPSTPLLGHALENDLNAIRLVHPTLVDTVFLFPHPKGLPMRNSLKNLVKTRLGMDIQQAGAAGHDSFEDARATGELVRYKIKHDWKKDKAKGWEFRNDELFPPVPDGPIPLDVASPPLAPPGDNILVAGEKRKISDLENDRGEDRDDVSRAEK